ncbi:MAG: efflux RND transporter permease subunit [Gammaproteobacteria bacterium]|nr:efflux RND transporter permease subunit [Gammaproteobacteria bacterium]
MVKFTDIFIKRPVLATTLSLIILLVGAVSLSQLQVRLFPKLDSSVITVNTVFSGANADLMEGFVSSPIENAIAGIEGVDYMASTSTQGDSNIVVHMKLGYDIDKALTDITNRVQSVRWKLPKEIQDPTISKNDPGDYPIMWVYFSSDTMNGEAVTDYLLRNVQPQLQDLPGVSEANVMGTSEYAMRIWLNPNLMAAHGITASDVQQALENNNVQAASGSLKSQFQIFNIYSTTDLRTANQFNNLVVNNRQGRLVRIKDIGEAQLGAQSDDASIYMNGKRTTFIAVKAKSTANPLNVAKEILKIMPDVEKHLPATLKGGIFWNSTDFISASLHEVERTILEASLFVFIVIFLMIGSLRSVFVPVITIPLSIIGVCGVMLALGYSINTLTLLAFVFAIGLVVDDAIVVLENIHRHLGEGLSPKEAAITGAREIATAVIAMSLTLAAVYAPIGFMSGLTGKLFSEFAFTLAGAVIISGFIALTLSPMMCSKVYRENEDLHAGLAGISNRIFERLRIFYKFLLDKALKFRFVAIVIALIVYASCYFLYVYTPKELAPKEDQSVVYSMVTGPATANLNYMEQHTKIVANTYKTVPGLLNEMMINGWPSGENSAIAILQLKPWNQRKITAMQVQDMLFPKLWAIPGIQAFPALPPTFPGAGGFNPIEFVLKTTEDYPILETQTQQFMDAINAWGGLIHVDSDLKIDLPQTVVDINRDLATDLGVLMSDIADNLNIFLSEPTVTRFNLEGRSYEVLPQLYQRFRETPNDLNNLNVRTASGGLVPLSNLVTISEQVVPRSLNHFQQLRSATVSAGLAPGVTLGDAISKLNSLAAKTLPKNVQVDYSGQSRQYVQASGRMALTFVFALIFIFLILAAQFESFLNPLIVMLSVPLSIAGALMTLYFTGSTLNIYTEIGLVTLIGLITKSGILIVEFTNQQRAKGVAFRDAILNAASFRLRPILMTTFAMILGALPLALATGAGAVSRRQIGLTIIGGISFGTLLTLFVVPIAYYLLVRDKKK